MADIELVIKIPKDTYKATCNENMLPPDVRNVVNAIKNGTPLPKGHGRLIDANELEECKEIMTTYYDESKYAVRMDDIRDMPTIVEADRESEV